jgi:alanyl-tRNA synthetase
MEKMGSVYPNMVENRDYILNLIDSEEDKFSQTLNTGLNLLDGIIEKVGKKEDRIISGKEVFKLYDTYGFPKELTAEVAADNGLSVDIGGFENEMDKQRQRARAAQKSKEVTSIVDYKSLMETEFVGYDSLSFDAHVLSIAADGRSQSSASKGEQVSIILDKSPFYAEKGGQVADIGILVGKEGKVIIDDTRWANTNHVMHFGKVTEGSVSVGHAVLAQVDKERRMDIARNHTATHLLQAALRDVLGDHVRQTGSLVDHERLRFDFSHSSAVTGDELLKIQRYVNDKIRQNLEVVVCDDMPIEQAKAAGAIALFGEKYSDKVRMLKVGEPAVSVELCGGTHLQQTGQIGICLITSESSVGAGVRRIEAVTGRGAEALIESRLSAVEALSQRLGAPADELNNKLQITLNDLSAARKRLSQNERDHYKNGSVDLLDNVVTVEGISVLAASVSASNVDAMRQIGDMLKERMGSGVIVLGALQDEKPFFIAMVTADLVKKGIHAVLTWARPAEKIKRNLMRHCNWCPVLSKVSSMRALGLDVGQKRIGVALSDNDGILASPLTVIDATDTEQALSAISELCDQYHVERIVVGLPISMDGTLGKQAEVVQLFIRQLTDAIKITIDTWDERLSSIEADRAMIAAGIKKDKKKNIRDAIAAAIILQGYLDRKRNE